MDTVPERLVAYVLRSIARAVLFAGISMLPAGMPLFVLLRSESAELRQIAVTLLQLGGVLITTGIIARYCLQPGRRSLHNEQVTIAEAQRPTVGGWLMGLAFMLVAAPLMLLISLQPFLAEGMRVYVFLQSSIDWSDAGRGMGGIALLPIFGALTPALIEFMAMAAFVGTSALLFPLLCVRSYRFPRFYVVCLVLVSGLALASLLAAYGVSEIAGGLQQMIDTTSATAGEAAEFRQGLDRYTNAVGLPVLPLVITWFAYAAWLAPLVSSPRARDTFASPVVKPIATPATAQDIATITTPPRFPGLF